MALIFNGVIIPQNKAGVFHWNGVEVTNINVGGVEVWKQQLFSATWSGSTFGYNSSYRAGIDTSENLFRYVYTNSYPNDTSNPTWLSVYDDGTFQSGLTVHYFCSVCAGIGINTTSNSMKLQYWDTDSSALNTLVYFNISSGFTGSSGTTSDVGYYLETSSGLIRSRVASSYGVWISLK